MADLLNIDAETYAIAADQIREDLQDVKVQEIDDVLHAYVSLGVNKKIQDYGNVNSQAKFVISNLVRAASVLHRVIYPLNDVQNILNSMTTLALGGTLDQRIAYPRTWQERQEQAQADSHATSPGGPADTGILKNLNDVFSGIFTGSGNIVGKTLKSIADGLGVPIDTIVFLIIIVIIFLIMSNLRINASR